MTVSKTSCKFTIQLHKLYICMCTAWYKYYIMIILIIIHCMHIRGLHGPGGPGLEISVFKRAGPGPRFHGPGRARDFTGRAGPEIRGKSPNSNSKRNVLGLVYE